MDKEQKFTPNEAVLKASEGFYESLKDRSYSGRHPELGKMIKCAVCGLRHRAAKVCIQHFLGENYHGTK